MEENGLDLDEETLGLVMGRLEDGGVELRFSCGDWKGFAEELEKEGGGCDLVLTAETIYQLDSVGSLLRVIKAGYQVGNSNSNDPQAEENPTSILTRLQSNGTIVLVAAKVLYFGVGGSLLDFISRVEKSGGSVEEVKSWIAGVGRRVIQVSWK